MTLNRREMLTTILVIFPLGKTVARTELAPRDTDDREWDEWLEEYEASCGGVL